MQAAQGNTKDIHRGRPSLLPKFLESNLVAGPRLTVSVDGDPVGQGNIAHGRGRSWHREGPRLAAWREQIALRFAEAERRADGRFETDGGRVRFAPRAGGSPWLGEGVPAIVAIVFALEKPRTSRRAWPTVRPDGDKLERAVLDAISMAGRVWVDDAQVVGCAWGEVYGDRAGAVITVAPALAGELAAAPDPA